jgi:formate-dependent phosphoribosylglycinamide formyltransferase (GAR transformylase)
MIKKLKTLGFHVIVCGIDPNEPGHSLSHESIFIDYSNAFEVREYLELNEVDFVLPTGNDKAYRTGLKLSDEFGFPGYDTFEDGLFFLEKNRFRVMCDNLDLKVPFFVTSTSNELLTTQVRFETPFLVKPTQGFSGIGIIKILNESERPKLYAIEGIQNSADTFVIEEFLEGSLHSHSAFIQDRRIIQDFFVDEFCTVNEFAVDSSNHPSQLSEKLREHVREMVAVFLNRLDLVDGLIHTQFMISQGEAVLIESMRRCPGDLFPNLIHLSSGFDYVYNYIAPFANLPFETSKGNTSDELPIARFTLARSHESQFFGFNVDSECSKFSFYPLAKNGDRLEPFPQGKSGVLFVELVDKSALFSKVSGFQQMIGYLN